MMFYDATGAETGIIRDNELNTTVDTVQASSVAARLPVPMTISIYNIYIYIYMYIYIYIW